MNTRNRNIRRYYLYVMLLCLLAMSVVSCGGGGGSAGNDYTPPQPTVGVPHDIMLSSDRTVGQSNSPIYMTALVTDVNGRPVKNTEVTFTKTSTAGNISPSLLNDFAFKDIAVYKVQTDVYGRASIKVNSTASGYVTVEAYTGGGLMARRSMLFTSSGTIVNQFTPISVVLDIDGNNNGTYNEKDDYKVCQSKTDQIVRVKTTVYFKGEKAAGIGLFVATDLSNLVDFYNNIYGIYSVNSTTGVKTLMGCDYNGNGAIDAAGESACFTTHNNTSGVPSYWFSEDRVYTNSSGEAKTEFRISCQTVTQERLISVLAMTDSYSFPEFSPTVKYYGTGSTTLFIEPIVVSSVTVTADPTEVAVGQTSYITAKVNTTLGDATAPDGTFVQFYADCKDSTATALSSLNPQTAQIVNGKATTIFTAPTQIPTGDTGQCTIEARVGAVSGFVALTVNRALEVTPSSQTLSDPEVGDTATFNVVGGSKPYSVRSGHPAVSVAISGSKITATVASVPDDDTLNVPITVSDAKHVEVIVTLVLASEPLSVIPTTQSLTSPAVGTSVTYTVRGGKRPYQVSVSDPQLVSASISGSTLTVTTIVDITSKNAKTVTLTVMDNKGKTATASLALNAISASNMKITPPTRTLSSPSVGTAVTYTISGGKAPYSVTVDKPQMVSATVSGNTITVTTLVRITSSNAGNVTIYATDSADESATASLSLSASASSLEIVPSSQTIQLPKIGQKINYTILGGTPDYTVTASGSDVFKVSIDQTTKVITLECIALIPPFDPKDFSYVVDINVIDSNDLRGTATLNVIPLTGGSMTVSPASRTSKNPAIGTKFEYTASGGTMPYKVTVSNPGLVKADVSNSAITLTTLVAITEKNADTVIIYVSDVYNVTAQAQLVLQPSSADSLVITPATRILTTPIKGTIVTYTVSGGKTPYTVTTDSPQLVSASVTGSTVTLTLLKDLTSGEVKFYVTDANGLTGSGALSIATGAFSIYPETITMLNPDTTSPPARFDIFGGTPPFKIYVDRPDLLSAKTGTSSGASSSIPLTVSVIKKVTASDNGTTVNIQVLDATTSTSNCGVKLVVY
ncbi:membrane or secreted protein containing Bacterial Ig-like, group 1 domain protein [Candidatus Magnetobacterium bavaricum]|uniref:Membrane or secreted protein containing Bacterial Ig-like, group 1 domain protein n=1 Tax=Candidatus Magnetobacterium bavaricum TaxID=29290 RepID=A0A0F3GWT7_9BACT|nr:membrane or secreted protein containing Bacterial Ig-like, group 1 domain protein [Candidatus Magnetobacterium bavaricum]